LIGCALVVAALAGCSVTGAGGVPSRAQLRSAVERYLTAPTAHQRCELFTTVYRTMNPVVLLSGGCERSEQRSAADEAELRALRIARLQVTGSHATAALRPTPARTIHPDELTLLVLYLVVEDGTWRIDGFGATAHGSSHV
jgi:hypothetical protein